MQNNDGTLTLNPTLTEIGKKRLLNDQFKITKFAIADDGVNYKLINENISIPELAVERSPVLSAWKDSSFNLNNKIRLVEGDNLYFSEVDFNPSVTSLDGEVKVFPKGFGKEVNFPRILKTEGNITVQFYLTNTQIAKKNFRVLFSFSDEVVSGERFTGDNIDQSKILVANLSDSKYFDLVLSDKSPHKNIFQKKNFPEAFETVKGFEKYPKTVNIYCGSKTLTDNSFMLYYKGNYRYENIDSGAYETMLSLSDEKSGRFQKIKLQIIPVSSQKEN